MTPAEKQVITALEEIAVMLARMAHSLDQIAADSLSTRLLPTGRAQRPSQIDGERPDR